MKLITQLENHQMNSDSLFAKGRLAWSPCSRATNLEVWHEHEVPFVGTFDVSGVRILFTVVGSAESSKTTTVWGYTELVNEPPESFEDVKELRRWVHSQFKGSPSCFAVTSDLRIIRYSDTVTAESIWDGASVFLETLLEAIENPTARARARFSANQAEVELVGQELVDA